MIPTSSAAVTEATCPECSSRSVRGVTRIIARLGGEWCPVCGGWVVAYRDMAGRNGRTVMRPFSRAKLSLSGGLVLLALAVASVAMAAPANNLPSANLDAVATAVAGKPVAVWCEASDADWHAAMGGLGYHGYEVAGLTWIDRPVVYVSPTVCYTLHAALRGDTSAGEFWLGLAMLTLVHEAVHQRGIRDEAVTECLAMKLIPDVAQRFGYTPTVNVPTVQPYVKKVVRRINGRRVTIRVQAERVVLVARPNPRYTNLLAWADVWHRAAPAQYQGGAC